MPTIKSSEDVVLNLDRTIKHGNSEVGYIASVKNSPKGKAWISKLRKINSNFRVVIYPTGTKRRERLASIGIKMAMGDDHGDKLPWSIAERFRVYVYEKTYAVAYPDFSEVNLPK